MIDVKMKIIRIVSLISAVILVCLVSFLLANDNFRSPKNSQGQLELSPGRRLQFKLPHLRDFFHFKKYYHKVYRRHTENSRRAKLYLKRALNVFKNNILYLKRKSTKFLKINPTSDWTDKERDSIFSAQTTRSNNLLKGEKFLVTSSAEAHRLPVRRHRKGKVERRAKVAFKRIKKRLSHKSRHKSRKLSPINYQYLPDSSTISKSEPSFNSSDQLVSIEPDAAKLIEISREDDDQIFLDYRDTGCFVMPKSQEKCGACYIFSVTALFEYYHCRQTGKLVSFSEQYAIDCGRRDHQLNGCQGGVEDSVGDFFAQFGLESGRKYPFMAKEQLCPSRDDTNNTGYFRANDARIVSIEYKDIGLAMNDSNQVIQRWLEDKGPLTISVYNLHDFPDYGGGVDMVEDCSETGGHAMVIIGHGREDGLDYWLIRNSHGHDWGFNGHYKMAKKSNPKCIIRVGYMEKVPQIELNRKSRDNKKAEVIGNIHT